MTLTIAVFLLATVVWVWLPMNAGRTTTHWRTPEYFMAVAMFGFGGVGILFDLTSWLPENVLFALRFAPLVLGGLAVTLINFLNGAVVRPTGLLLLGIFAPMGAFAVVENAFIMPLLSLAIMAPAIFVPRHGYSAEPLYAGLRDAVRFTLAALAICILLAPAQLIGPCRGDKCSIWGLAIGPLSTGNALGVYLAFVAGLSVLLSRNSLSATLATVTSAILIDATSSRSALLAWGITVLAAHIWRLTRSGKRITLRAVSLGAAALVVIVGSYTWRPEDFTWRANLWIVAKELFASSPLLGYGPSFWVRQEATSYVSANYSTHNLFWELLVSGGIVGTALLVLALLSLIRSSHDSLQGSTLVLAAAWMGDSTLEVIAAPGRLYILPGALLLIFIHGQSALRNDDSARTSLGQAAANVDLHQE